MPSRAIAIEPLTGVIGAEVGNVSLALPLETEVYGEIREALNKYGVIFFRDQDINVEQYRYFAERFGTLTISPSTPAVAGFPQVAEIRKEPQDRDNIGGDWHTDQADRPNPIMGTMLLAMEIPASGGDTLFANMAAAYDALSPGLQATLSGMRAIHSHDYLMAQSKSQSGDMKIIPTAKSGQCSTHPVVIEHPETGRKVLYVNPGYTYQFEGWTRAESRPLLEHLFRQALQPEFTCRFRWRQHSLAFWDNRQTWHYAVNDYHGQRRLMYRIMVT